MTSIDSELRHKQPEHDAIANDLSEWLSHGGVIEKLGNSPFRDVREYNSRIPDYKGKR